MEPSRKIKFRQWHYPTNEYLYSDIYDGARRTWCSSVSEPEMFTGFHDEDGSSIYEGDYVDVYSFETQQKVFVGMYLIVWDQTHGAWQCWEECNSMLLYKLFLTKTHLTCKRRSSIQEDKNHPMNIA